MIDMIIVGSWFAIGIIGMIYLLTDGRDMKIRDLPFLLFSILGPFLWILILDIIIQKHSDKLVGFFERTLIKGRKK